MTQEQKLLYDALDELGGEPLDRSGFEAEPIELNFDDTYEFGATADGRS